MEAHRSSSADPLDFRFKGLDDDFGTGAAIAPQGSSSSTTLLAFVFKVLDVDLGAGSATAPHKSSSSSLLVFNVLFGLEFEAEPNITLPMR